MQDQPTYKLILWSLVTLSSLLCQGWAAKCAANDHAPTVQQTQVETTDPPKYMVEVRNSCPMCPVINVHLKCGSFPQALVSPRLLKVLAFDDCVVNAGLPLQPLQKLSFNYSHNKFLLRPTIWYFQCE
ncbi:PHD finger protein [Trema orientale]|uniref:PHD finger protein n=1 Tax=Trema orientale TaxID=63057 RepID=A0A2P5G2C8_TREOI|nr:PHD finger protein [Trema orientale]